MASPSVLLRAALPVLLAGAALFLLTASRTAPLIVGTDDWPPYEFKRDGEVVGICTDVLYAVLESMGEPVAPPVQYPWKRGMQMLERGEMDILYCGVRRESRMRFVRYPQEPLVSSRWVVMVREHDAERLDFKGLESFEGRRVGMVIGYAYTPEINAWAETAKNLERVPSDETLLTMLREGRLDYALCDSMNCQAIVDRLKLRGTFRELYAPPLSETHIYPLFSRGRVGEDFVRRFDEALREFKSTPEYEAILRRYLGSQ